MAQRTEKEEAEFKVIPETLTPCVNNCGVIGNPATNNMCQKCFKATTLSTAVKFSEGSPRSSFARSPERTSDPAETSKDLRQEDPKVKDESRREVNRCSGCWRKVGLTGFRCRCGELFCANHRYSDRHDCSYDYKTAGRDRIARENPVVKAAKIVKL